MKDRFAIFVILLVALGAVVGGLFGRMPSRTAAEGDVTPARLLTDYQEALKLIGERYVDPVKYEEVADTSMQSMLWTLDPHSAFFTGEEYRKMMEEQSSQFYGIGVSILQHRDGVYIQSVLPETPADKAGLRYGDRFVTVAGRDAKDWTSAEVSKNVRGEKGSAVKIQIERAASTKPLDFEIVRGGVPLPSIRNYFMLPNSIGYVGLTGGFQQTTGEELSLAVGEMKKRGMRSLILDLRGNPGGLLEQAIAVVSKFIPGEQTVVSVKGAGGEQSRDLRSTGGTPENFPLVVMINGNSASASEIVAGAVQDYGRGLVVGTDSFGKGLVQRVFRLPYDTGLTLTTARYYTPFGRSLQRDYSSGSIYEYYSHSDPAVGDADAVGGPKPAGVPITTPDGRTLYGGRGIEPDVVAADPKPSPARGRINEAAFHFVRQLVAGRVAGQESFRVEKQNFRAALQPNEFAVGDSLSAQFTNFAIADKQFGLSTENLAAQVDYVRRRLREEIATANYSTEAGTQVLLEADPQVLKAIEVMPQASEMAMLYARNRNFN
ncbi:MAG: S41 family peptidase [Pyrinomonadaceae bacterium]